MCLDGFIVVLICTGSFHFNFTLSSLSEFILQDGMDLIVGHYIVSRSNPSPFELNTFEAIAVNDLVLVTFFFVVHHLGQGMGSCHICYSYIYWMP